MYNKYWLLQRAAKISSCNTPKLSNNFLVYEYRVLMKTTLKEVHTLLTKYNKKGVPKHIKPFDTSKIPEHSVHAIKNFRRRMEDRHVVIPDLNDLLELKVFYFY